jgi:predicted PurR-regulated permease PerM
MFIVGVCVAIYYARHIILIFVFAILFTYLLDPLVKFLQRHSLFFKSLRGPAVVEVYVSIVILLAVVGYSFAPSAGRNVIKLIDETPVVLDRLSTGDIADDLGSKYGWSEEQEFRLRFFLTRHKEQIDKLIPAVDRYLSDTALIFGWLLLVPILAIFFLRDGGHITNALIQSIFPKDRRASIRTMADELHLVLTRYIRAQVLLCCLSFLFYSAALLILRFPHAFVLASLGGLLEFIPVVGWTSTFAAIVGIGIVNHLHWIWMAALLCFWRVLQDYVATPKIMGQQLKIHPLAAVFAVLVGAELGGVIGIYLAVPIVASVPVIWRMRAAEKPERSDGGRVGLSPDSQPILIESVTSEL